MMFSLSQSYLCPDGHVGNSAVQCDCGNSNLANLARILDREEVVENVIEESMYRGLLCQLPTIQKLFEN